MTFAVGAPLNPKKQTNKREAHPVEGSYGGSSLYRDNFMVEVPSSGVLI